MVVWSDASRRSPAQAEDPHTEFKSGPVIRRRKRRKKKIRYGGVFVLSTVGLNGWLFDCAGSDFLKSLTEPLYGNSPIIGIRELVQNAIDACRELKDYVTHNTLANSVDLSHQEGDVVISVESDSSSGGWLVVSDRGIGMTLDTVVNFFLRAGASYRFTAEWEAKHVDPSGNPRVLRTGRFGIGVLSTFLLGEEVHVSTRHVTSLPEDSLYFTCRLDEDTISIYRKPSHLPPCPAAMPNRPVGTTVCVRLSHDVYAGLSGWPTSWHWYRLANPSVVRKVGGEAIPASEADMFPDCGETPLMGGFRRCTHRAVDDVQWRPIDKNEDFNVLLNGIVLGPHPGWVYRGGKQWWRPYDLNNSLGQTKVAMPFLSIFDSRMTVPTDLQRTALHQHEVPFRDALISSIADDLVAHVLSATPSEPDSCYPLFDDNARAQLDYPICEGPYDFDLLMGSLDGVVLTEAALHDCVTWPRILVFCQDASIPDLSRLAQIVTDIGCPVLRMPKAGAMSLASPLCVTSLRGMRLYVTEKTAAWAYAARTVPEIWDNPEPLRRNGTWHEYVHQPVIAEDELADAIFEAGFETPVAILYGCRSDSNTPKQSILASTWVELTKSGCIPYDLKARHGLCSAINSKLPAMLRRRGNCFGNESIGTQDDDA